MVTFLANENHLQIIKKGVDIWNRWRQENPSIKPDLSNAWLFKADLSGADFSNANLSNAILTRANLTNAIFTEANLYRATLIRAKLRKAILDGVNLMGADLSGANLTGAYLHRAKLDWANLSGTNLRTAIITCATLNEANLTGANLSIANISKSDIEKADLSKANLSEADLSETRLINVRFNGATLDGCRVFGISAWGLIGLAEAKQSSLFITHFDEPIITVDNLEVAQFIYLLLNSEKIRGVIDTITSKTVLILGRFTPERKAILDAIKEELRKRNYLPILFDFEKPASRDLTETISTLAHMARFVIADITDPKSVPQELSSIIPFLTSVPVQPILLSSAKEYTMFEHFTCYPWVLNIYRYDNVDDLLRSLGDKVIIPAEDKAKELQKR
jgi:uncharacterized protein YjbI with pentapeptide repeats